MRFWAFTLRLLGSIMFIWTLASQSWWVLGTGTTLGTERIILTNILESAVLAVLCFAGAAALMRLEQVDARISRQNAAIRRLLPSDGRRPTDDSLAPTAPQNWRDFTPRPRDPEREKDSEYQQLLARRWRYRVKPTNIHTSVSRNDVKSK
jgi:hypothetical protein